MPLSWAVAVAHLLGLGIGLGSVVARSRALRDTLDVNGLRRVFAADTWWGVAAAIWLLTGLWRAFGGLEKPSAYYLSHPLFHAKIGLFVLIVLLELAPMIALIKWRATVRRGQLPDTRKARAYATIGIVQAIFVIAVVACAVGLARNYAF